MSRWLLVVTGDDPEKQIEPYYNRNYQGSVFTTLDWHTPISRLPLKDGSAVATAKVKELSLDKVVCYSIIHEGYFYTRELADYDDKPQDIWHILSNVLEWYPDKQLSIYECHS